MPRVNRPNRALLLGLTLSLAIHLGTLLGFGFTPLGALLAAASPSPAAPLESPKPASPDDDQPLHLGIADSDAVTVNWIGFQDPTEHHAPESTTDQPALARNPGPVPSPAVADAESQPQPPPQTQTPQVLPPQPAQAPSPADQQPARTAQQLGDLLTGLRPILEELISAASSALAAASQSPPTSGQPSSGDPGEPSDRDSDPTSIAGTIDVVLGHPVARRGLEIKTVRPNWLSLTRMTARPDNPTIVIKFLRDGTVSEADFEPGKSTGFTSVDGPLLDAIYAWRASGEALKRLPASNPEAALEVRIRVILR